MSARDLVLAYAAAGLPVFPLRGKLPLLPAAHPDGDPARGTCRGECGRLGHGMHDATTDLGEIAEWLAEHPRANWGIRPPAGLVVVDIDPRNGGRTAILELQREHGPLPGTLTATTGGGGAHLWFAYRGPVRGRLAPGLDVKASTGYVVAPPSVHPDTGRPYEWVDVDAPTAPAPTWLRRLLAPPPVSRAVPAAVSGDRRLAGLVRTVAEAQPGARNARLFWAACRAVEAGFDVGPLVAAAVAAGLPAVEAQRTAASAASRLEMTQ